MYICIHKQKKFREKSNNSVYYRVQFLNSQAKRRRMSRVGFKAAFFRVNDKFAN